MKGQIILFILVVTLATGLPVYGQIGWEWAIVESCNRESSGLDIVSDLSGNIYVTGYFREQATFGDTILNAVADADIFVAKYDSVGKLLWINQAGNTGEHYGNSIALDDSLNVYVASNMMVLKYSSDGTLRWQEWLGTVYHWENKRKVISITEDRLFVASNKKLHCFNKEGTNLGEKNLEVTCLSPFENGKFAAGTSGQIVVMDSGMNVIRNISLPPGIEFTGAILMREGDLFSTGRYTGPLVLGDSLFDGSHSMFIIRMDTAGKVTWANQAGGETYDTGNALVLNERGQLMVTGTFRNSAIFDTVSVGRPGLFEEIFVAQYDTETGRLNDLITAGGQGNFDVAYGMCGTVGDQLLVTGSVMDFYNGINFGDILVSSFSGNIDFFLAKVSQPEVKAKISGSVLIGGNPGYSRIRVYRFDPDSTTEQVYNIFLESDGLFNLDIFSKGEYLLRADHHTNQYASTYLGHEFMWDRSERLMIDSDTIIDSIEIHLLELPLMNGIHSIKGTVFDSGDNPARFIDMLLVSDEDSLLGFTRTDTMGHYVFENVEEGIYRIWVDTAGIVMNEYHTVSVTGLKSTGNIYGGYNYYLKERMIFAGKLASGVQEEVTANPLHIFPVPARDLLYISVPEQGPVTFEIFDQRGSVVNIIYGINSGWLDVSGLQNGIYYVRSYRKDQVETGMFIILR
jgi:hypothetical protein